MKSKLLFILFCFLGCASSPVVEDKSDGEKISTSAKECFISPSELKTWSANMKKQFLDNPEYDVIYDNENIQPYIVVYELKYSNETHTLKRESDFSNKFIPDSRVKRSANDQDYRRSGWDKGHLAPSKDFTFEVQAARSTFLYSNISPQNPFFNRKGSWRRLEDKVRNISRETDEPIQIISGPIIVQHQRLKELDNAPTIPDYFFKTIIKKDGEKCTYVSFILKNDSKSGDFCKDRVQEDLVPSLIKSHLKDANAKEFNICK